MLSGISFFMEGFMAYFPVADGHCDFLYGMVQYGYDLQNPHRDQTIRLKDMQEGGVGLQCFAAWTDMSLRTPPLHQCLAMIDAYERMMDDNRDVLVPFTADFQPGEGHIATVLTVEGGEAIDGSKAMLRTLRRLGVRAMTLTWNDNNELAGAALDRGNKGLTSLGREIIEHMNELNIAVDVSHLSDRGIDDVLKYSEQPIYASHSNARAVYRSERSLSDDHIREIAKRGGTIGVNFYYQQLCAGKECCISDIVKHIRHIVRTGGIDCCAIGSDLDGMTKYPNDFKTSRDFPALAQALLNVGFTQIEVEKIFYGNLTRYLKQFI